VCLCVLAQDATGAGQTVGRGKPNIQSILSRLAGKTGRFRGGMGSKRVGECARSVISGGVKQRVNQIGVPVAILMVNVKREVVNDLNRLELQVLC
jgi:DNA-directed RNA polymerase III subunit RPC1